MLVNESRDASWHESGEIIMIVCNGSSGTVLLRASCYDSTASIGNTSGKLLAYVLYTFKATHLNPRLNPVVDIM
jgi:hypothetical protein